MGYPRQYGILSCSKLDEVKTHTVYIFFAEESKIILLDRDPARIIITATVRAESPFIT